jgi:hypothetical protein
LEFINCVFGNNWLGLYFESSIFSLKFVLNICALGLTMVGLAFLSATLNGQAEQN